MGDVIRKFVPRAFRYVLRPQDRNTMRFSLEKTLGPAGIEETILVNLSETGVAFLVSPDADVKIYERIKVEIPVPEGDQIAWWGRVVRIQQYEPSRWHFGKDPFRETPRVLVAVTFDQLPEPHSKAIRKGIEASFMKAMREQHYRNWLYYRALVMRNAAKALFFFGLIAGFILFMWYFTLPSDNYDPKHGAPWGERFKFFKDR